MRQNQVTCESCPAKDQSVFQGLNHDELSLLSQCKTTNKYKKNQIVFYENNKPFGVHCIRGGRLKLIRTGIDGREHIIRIVEPGDIVGFQALMTDHTYSVSAQAIEDTEVCFIDRGAFFNLMDRSQSLARKLLETNCNRTHEDEDRLCSLNSKNVRERMAETLLILKERFGEKTDEGWLLRIPLKREEIASLAGTVIESAVRYLSEFNSEGVITLSGKDILIRDLVQLKKLAGD